MRRLEGIRWLFLTARLGMPAARGRAGRRGRWSHVAVERVDTLRRLAYLAIVLLVDGVVIVAAAIGFPPPAATAVAFGMSIAALVVGLALAVSSLRRSPVIAAIAVVATLLAVWTVAATAGVFPHEAARWIAFGSGVGLIAHAIAVIVAHVRSVDRTVHVLEVRDFSPR